jgi:ubiquinone/menaquinone biosynthesis C-methylase UbiE
VSESDRILTEYARRAEEVPAERYAPTNPAQLFIHQGIERALVRMLGDAGLLPLAGRRILDVGCGYGQWLADLESLGAERSLLAGIDLVPERAERARERLGGADVRVGDATSLPFADGSFDLVLQSMMFSSILDASVKRAAAAEMARVLAPGAAVLWYDFFVDNPRNRNVRGVGRREVGELFPGFSVRWRRVTLAPPLVRALAPRLHPLASALQAARVLNTHALAVLSRA